MSDLTPIDVEVAFDSEVKARLYVNKHGTIVGPERTETIISLSEAVEAGYDVKWNEKEFVMKKDGVRLQVEVHHGTPVLPHEECLKLIDEIEKTKEAKTTKAKVEESKDDDFELKSLWPQLSKVVKWLIQNQFDKALEVMRLIICRRRYEIKRDTPHLDVE